MNFEKSIELQEALDAFPLKGTILGAFRYGSGHINDTYAVSTELDGKIDVRYILQRINTTVFKRPDQLMSNIVGVTTYLQNQIMARGGDPDREALTVILTVDGNHFFTDSKKGVWRCYLFIMDSTCIEKVENPVDFYSAAKSYGRFMRQLENYPADTLFETIDKFHDTRNRLKNFKIALEADKMNRAEQVKQEIEFVEKHEADCAYLMNLLDEGKLPLRVTHNDTKINNVLFDAKTIEGLCVIDLDTIMPGLVLNDFGDAIRSGATTAAEDEPDLSKVHFDLALFDEYTRGYLETAGDALTPMEKKCLPWGAKMMTLECGIRFLTDHLDGDVYFKIHRENHNLDRARTQFKMVAEMEQHWDEMGNIIAKYS